MSLIQERNQLANDMQALHAKAEEEKRGFTVDEKQKWSDQKDALAVLDERIANQKEAGELKQLEERSSLGQENGSMEQPEGEVDYGETFDRYMRSGAAGLNAEQRSQLQQRAQSTTTTAGGYTIPEGFGGRVIEAMKQYGGLEQFATVLTTSTGNDIPFPTNDDTGNIGELLAENTATAEQDTVFGQAVLGAYMYSSKMIRVSNQLLTDNEVNLENHLVGILGKRLGRIQAAHFATGTGSGQPNGILSASTAGATAAAAAAIALSDLTAIEHSVDPAYRMGGQGTFLFNDSTFKAIKDLEDADGRPLWRPSVAESIPATINGYRFGIDTGYASIATGNKVATFGDHSAYTIRRVNGVVMQRLAERYAEFFQVAFLGFNRADGELLDTSAVKHLVMA